jgi:DNA-binding Lrp family transcriptional regulator
MDPVIGREKEIQRVIQILSRRTKNNPILLGEPGVASLHDTNGRWDLLAELRAENLKELSDILERIRLIRSIQTTETSIHLATYRT